MILLVTSIPVDQFPADPLGIPVFSDLCPPHREAGNADFRLGGLISKWMRDGTLNPEDPIPTLFSGAGRPFPMLFITGGGAFHQESPERVIETLGALTGALLRARVDLFSLAVRDFRKTLTSTKDAAEFILRGIVRGYNAAMPYHDTIRLHWDEDQAELLVQELKRFRFHLAETKDWEIARAPEDVGWLGATP